MQLSVDVVIELKILQRVAFVTTVRASKHFESSESSWISDFFFINLVQGLEDCTMYSVHSFRGSDGSCWNASIYGTAWLETHIAAIFKLRTIEDLIL